MIEILEVMDVDRNTVNLYEIKFEMTKKYGDDVRFGYSYRRDLPDQLTVYKVIPEEDE